MKTPTQLLWERFGSAEHPSEWDGRDGNGGLGSQRFWEYLWTLQNIVTPQSVLDVGAGESLFFVTLLGDSCGKFSEIVALDPTLKQRRSMANYFIEPRTLEEYRLLRGSTMPKFNPFDWIICISVLEHVPDKPAFCAALDSFDAPIAMTFEFGEGAVTQAELYKCLREFRRHHISKMELCPVVADNSRADLWRPMALVLMPNL